MKKSKKLSLEAEESKGKKGLNGAECKKEFSEPKLTFIEPTITKQGDATKITSGFFGTFYP